MRSTTLALIATCVAGCATLTQDSLDQRYGRADTTRFDRLPVAAAGGVSYRDDVRPILDKPLRRLPRLLRRAVPAQARLVGGHRPRHQQGAGVRLVAA